MQQIVNIAKENYVLITPDGPRGPLYKLKAGAIVASKRTQTPIYLIGVDVNKKYISKKSWDKFCVPLPFARIKIKISEPIIISEIATTEEIDDLILKYEYQLNEMYENLIY